MEMIWRKSPQRGNCQTKQKSSVAHRRHRCRCYLFTWK